MERGARGRPFFRQLAAHMAKVYGQSEEGLETTFMPVTRRDLVKAAILTAAATAALPTIASSRPFVPRLGPRCRVMFVNDLAGDLDGLYALVHALLSPSLDLRGIIASSTGMPGESAAEAVGFAHEILGLMDMQGKVPVHLGAAAKLASADKAQPSAGTDAIIAEAMRTDSRLPLYVAVGGGLTEVASALIREPAIASRMTLVWIGGDAYPDGGTGETNFNIDSLAAMHVFNVSEVPIWQVPRAAYATCMVSASELETFVAPHGRIGEWLYRQVTDAPKRFRNALNTGETWTLGDNPLVLLTALTAWHPSAHRLPLPFEGTGSSLFDETPAPILEPDGRFSPRQGSRKIRIYRSVDNRMMMADMFAKLKSNYPA